MYGLVVNAMKEFKKIEDEYAANKIAKEKQGTTPEEKNNLI